MNQVKFSNKTIQYSTMVERVCVWVGGCLCPCVCVCVCVSVQRTGLSSRTHTRTQLQGRWRRRERHTQHKESFRIRREFQVQGHYVPTHFRTFGASVFSCLGKQVVCCAATRTLARALKGWLGGVAHFLYPLPRWPRCGRRQRRGGGAGGGGAGGKATAQATLGVFFFLNLLPSQDQPRGYCNNTVGSMKEHKKTAISQPLLETAGVTAAEEEKEEEEEEEAAAIGSESPALDAIEERADEAHNASGGRRLANVIVVTIGMSLLFMAYNTLQAYVSSLLPGNLGFQSLVVVYVAYELCLVISPFACEVLGDIGAMVLGSSCYVVYIGSLITMNAGFILAASALLGFGAAILWVGQGSALTRWSTDETRGKYAGIFWGGFQVSAVVGPLTSFMVLSDAPDNDKVTDLFVVFAAVSVLAVGVFSMHWCSCIKITFAADTAKKLKRENSIASGDKQPSFWSRMCAPVARGIQLCRTRDVALLLMACLFTGVETSFSNGEFFKLVGLLPCDAFSSNQTSCLNQSAGCLWNETAAAATCAKDVNIISLVFIAFGVGDVLGGYLLGALSDCCARSPSAGVCRKLIVTFGTICYSIALGLTYWMKTEVRVQCFVAWRCCSWCMVPTNTVSPHGRSIK